MLFNSIEFLIFFVAVSISYFSLPHKIRWIILLTASCIFYFFFKAVFILILAFTIALNYYAAILIERQQDKHRKKIYLISSIAANISVLVFFKYFNFLNGNLSGLLTWMGFENRIPFLEILLPVGLSFHALQATGYTIEVYRGNQKTEYHFGIFALFVMFYPQLAAGPIERPQNLLRQLKEQHEFSYEGFKSGLNLMIWGFVKKILVADKLSVYVDKVYGDCTGYDSLQLAIATVFFAIQVYCDFSAYSDIAVGASRTMGINLVTNFNRPYFSTNIREFWTKWHISLTSWFRDYLYIPLGGNRVPFAKQIFIVVIVFIISGLWHSPSFIIWAALHAFYMVVYMILEKYKVLNFKLSSITKTLSIIFTFLIVSYAWVFFRANSLQDAWFITSKLFNGNWSPGAYKQVEDYGPFSILITVLFSVYVLFVEQRTHPLETGSFKSVNKEIVFAILNIALILIFGSFKQLPFIYFKF